MLEARLQEASMLKKLLDAIKELVTDANFQCNDEGMNLQAMDNSHVALVAVKLEPDGFKKYRCDRPIPLGLNLSALTKVLKCAKDDDQVTIKANDDADVLSLTYEARNSDRVSDYDMKLMDIDADTLQIPDTDYDARVTMPSAEFARIVRDLGLLGESVRIEVSKEGVRFSAEGESANGSVLLKQTDAARERYKDYGLNGPGSSSKNKDDEDDEDEENEEPTANGDASGDVELKKEKKVKKEKGADAMDEDEEDKDDGDGEFKAKSDDEGESEKEEEEEEESKSKKRKRPAAPAKAPAKKKSKKSDDGPDDGGVSINMNQHVALTFSLKYLVNFAKSTTLSNTVQLMMKNDVPLLVAYDFGPGHIHYYLAPKIGDD